MCTLVLMNLAEDLNVVRVHSTLERLWNDATLGCQDVIFIDLTLF